MVGVAVRSRLHSHERASRGSASATASLEDCRPVSWLSRVASVPLVPVGLMRDESIAPSGPITREEERGRRDLLGLSQPLHCVVRDQRRDHGVGIRSIL